MQMMEPIKTYLRVKLAVGQLSQEIVMTKALNPQSLSPQRLQSKRQSLLEKVVHPPSRGPGSPLRAVRDDRIRGDDVQGHSFPPPSYGGGGTRLLEQKGRLAGGAAEPYTLKTSAHSLGFPAKTAMVKCRSEYPALMFFGLYQIGRNGLATEQFYGFHTVQALLEHISPFAFTHIDRIRQAVFKNILGERQDFVLVQCFLLPGRDINIIHGHINYAHWHSSLFWVSLKTTRSFRNEDVMEFVFSPAEPVNLPVAGTDKRFPVRRIYCIGKNYAKHVVEMGGDAKRSEPIFFTKAAETIVHSGTVIPFPPNTKDLHHEVELVVAMGPNGVFGYGVGIDMTRRDLQSTAKSKGGPWDRSKNFPQSAPCSKLTPADQVNMDKAHMVLRKNGDIVQSACVTEMIWSVDEIITRLTEDMDLQAGDLIFTGTPEGVGPVIAGDELSGGIEGLERITIRFT